MLGGYPTTGKALPDTTHLQFLHIGWLIHHSSIPCAKAGFIQNVYTLHPKFATCNKKNQPPAVFSLSFSMVFCSFFFWLFWLSPRSIPRVYRSLVPSLQELIKEGVELSSLPTWVCQADGLTRWPLGRFWKRHSCWPRISGKLQEKHEKHLGVVVVSKV